MAPPRITTEERRRLLVQRQLLGPRPATRSVGDVAEAIGFLHSTDPSTPYLSLQARSDVTIADIDAAFFEERSLIRHTTIRRTVFAMPFAAASAAHGAVNPTLVAKLRRQLLLWLDASDDVDDDPSVFLGRTEAAVLERLRDGEPATGAQLARDVPALTVRFDPMPGASYSKPMRITSKVLELLATEGRLARARPTGASFTSAAWTWTVFGSWFGRSFADDPDPAESLVGLLDRYLAAFGPATVTDMSWWTGVAKGRVRAALASLGATEVALERGTEPGFIRRGDDLAPHDDAAGEPSVALLPGLDPTTMGWKQRDWYVDDRAVAGLFDRNGNAGPTIWVDGEVVGAWTQREDGEIVSEFASPVATDVVPLVQRESERLAAWLGDVRVTWRYPTPATRRLGA